MTLTLRRRLLPLISLSPAYPSRYGCVRRRPWLSGLVREMLAECLATFVQMLVGEMAVAQLVIGGGNNGNWLAMALSWGLAVMLGVYVAGGVSGAHMNPAVTLALAINRGFEWYKVVGYWAAQFTGAFLGTAVAYLVYYDAVAAFDVVGAGHHFTDKSAGIFMTMPAPWLTARGAAIDNMVGTALLLMGICALTDARNVNPVAANLAPLLLGLTVTTVALTAGMNGGAAINPVRDFPQRLFLSMAGWGGGVFSRHGWYWPVPLLCPLVGAQIGVLAYDLCVSVHHDRAVGALKGTDAAAAAAAAGHAAAAPTHVHELEHAHGNDHGHARSSSDDGSYGSSDLQLQPASSCNLAPVIDIHAVGGLACAELSDPKGMVHVNQGAYQPRAADSKRASARSCAAAVEGCMCTRERDVRRCALPDVCVWLLCSRRCCPSALCALCSVLCSVFVNAGFLDPSIKASADATFYRKNKSKAYGSIQEPLLRQQQQQHDDNGERDAPL